MYLTSILGSSIGCPPAIFISPAVNQVPGTNGGMPSDYPSAQFTPIVVDVPGAPSSLTITVILLGKGSEVVYTAGAFTSNYAARSSASSAPSAEGTGSTRFTILRQAPSAPPAAVGWPGAGASTANGVQVLVQRVDSGVANSAVGIWQMPSQPTVAIQAAPAGWPVAVNLTTEMLGRLPTQFRSQH
jgi:hypothetical protein